MKRMLIAVCIGSLALSAGAYAEKQDGNKGRRAAVSAQRGSGNAHVQRSRQVKTRQNMRAQSVHRVQRQNVQRQNNVARRSFQRQQTVNAQNNARATARAQARQTNRQNRITAREQAANNNRSRVTANNRVANANNRRQALREQRAANRQQRVIDRETNRNNRIVNRTRNVNRNVRVVNNWRGERFAGRHYAAFRNYRRAWHDRHWWHNHYNRIIFVSGGWYFWNAGFWYPAWGYDPGYVYPYDGPIYGYGDLTPDQVVVNVQAQLRDDGYYLGAVDGILGPQTREALAAFQADHGLAVTSAVDEPTLASLGLV